MIKKLKSVWKILFLSSFALTQLTGCGEEAPKADLASVTPTTVQQKSTQAMPVYNLTTGEIPYPNDVLFSGSTDGTLNIPIPAGTPSNDPRYGLNALDGFSTSSAISVGFNKALDATTLSSGVKVLKVSIDPITKAVTGYVSTLTYGSDYALAFSNNKLIVLPLKPLEQSSGYLVVLTNDLKDEDGQSVQSNIVYQYLKSSASLVDANGKSVVSGLPDASAAKLEPLRQLTQAQLNFASTAGVAKEKVVLSWSFSTQSIGTVLSSVTQSASNTTLQVQNTNLNTSDNGIGGQGLADIYVGTITLPYYQALPSTQNPTAPITQHWQGLQGGELTRYAIVAGDSPKKQADVIVPVIMTVPNSTSGQTQPSGGWPVVIFQHGITGNRTHVLALADSLAQVGYAAVAIDMPLHGITDTTSPFYQSGKERTFDLDLVSQNSLNQVIGAGQDGVVDSSGTHFIQLTSLLTTRDNMRQAISDLVQLKSALSNVSGASIDGSKVSFIGHSLGGMVGAGFVKRAPDLKAAVFAMSGLQAPYILANSATFGSVINEGLKKVGIEPGSAEYAQFLLAAQTIVDSGDPVNMLSGITVPTLMLEVVGDGNEGTSDQVIPNRVSTAPLAGTEPWITLQNLQTITATVTGSTTINGVIRYTAGTHKSILDPSASLAVTTSMQTAAAAFVASNGTQVNVGSDTSVIKQ